MSAIAAFRTAISAILDDATNVHFTSTQVDQGLRAALNEYSRAHPLKQTYNFSGIGELVLELPADFAARNIYAVELHDTSVDVQEELLFHAYQVDSSWFIRLFDRVVGTTESIDIFYTKDHIIDGLDSAAGTSILAEDENALQQGAAGYAALQRAVSRAESVNLQPGVTQSLMSLSKSLLSSFRQAIQKKPGAAFAVLPAIPTDKF